MLQYIAYNVLTTRDEIIDDSKPYEIFDPRNTWKRKIVTGFTAKELQIPIFVNGECVYESPSLKEIKSYCKEQLLTIWDEVKRFENPHEYYVDMSQKLWNIRYDLLAAHNC